MFSNLPGFNNEVKILKDLFENSYEQAGGKGHRFFHSIRVARNCLKLYQKIFKKDAPKRIAVAGLFHDIGKFSRVEANGYLDGSQKADALKGKHDGVETIFPLLCKYLKKRYSLKELKLIAAYISGDGSPESKLLQDADNLDEVGLINIWKMFTYSGLNKVSIKDTADYYFKAERQRQLKKIKSEINFPEAKKIGIERLQKTDEFLRALIDESKGL